MNTLIVVYSQYGNTRRLAEAMAATLRADGGTVDVVDMKEVQRIAPAQWAQADLVILGAPTHNQSIPQAVRTLLDALPDQLLANKPVATFDTAYPMGAWLAPFSARRPLAAKARRLGARVINPTGSFYIERDHAGPLRAGEEARACAWVQKAVQNAAQPQMA